jgi:hypothetical protein
MPAIIKTAPKEESYNFVVGRTDINTESHDARAFEFHSYSENQDSRLIVFGSTVYHMLFLRTKEAKDRACCTGWMDLTPQWNEELNSSRVEATTDSQRQILAALADGEWHNKKFITSNSTFKDTEWRTAIKTLMDRKLVECNIYGMMKGRASNRGYKYRLVVND